MKTLYFDCFSGISGDMTIGALLDLGLDFDYLKTELKKLPVEGYELRASRVMRSNLSAMKFDVLMEGAGENHRHEHHHGGHSHIHCQHGIMPVPVPATADLLRHAPIYQKHAQTELVTPTGAAILAAVVNRFGPMPAFSSDRIGYGAGTKQFPDFPNCLRLMIGEETAVPPDRSSRSVVVLEANIDDMTPQNFGYVTEKLFAAGALDVLTIPVQMKKGRPGHLKQVQAAAMKSYLNRENAG